jgi:hypothetical protein
VLKHRKCEIRLESFEVPEHNKKLQKEGRKEGREGRRRRREGGGKEKKNRLMIGMLKRHRNKIESVFHGHI